VRVCEPRPVRRYRRTKDEIQLLDFALAEIVAEVELAKVRQVFYQAVVRDSIEQHMDPEKLRLLKLAEEDEREGFRSLFRRHAVRRERRASRAAKGRWALRVRCVRRSQGPDFVRKLA
jgi:hypothetical protein